MAYVTENTYTGNGSTVLYSFTFPYLETTDIKVTVAEAARAQGSGSTEWTLPNATQIQFNTAPTNGQAIRIYRDTDIDNLKAEFFAGSAIRSQDLNEDFLQNLYNSQEAEADIADKWNNSSDTIDSTEAFADSNTKIMTAAAIDDRINANIASQPLANGKIFAGNGSGVAAAVTPSGDVTMANTGAFTIANTSVETGMIAADAITSALIGDDQIDSEHYAADSIDTEHYAPGSVDSTAIADGTIVNADISGSADIAHSKLANLTDGRILVGNGSNVPVGVTVSGDVTLANTGAVTIANDAVEQVMIADDAVGADQLAANAVVNASVAAGAAITLAKLEPLDNTKIIVGNGSNVATEVTMSGDATIASTGAVTIASGAVETGMIADDAVDADKLAANAVVNASVASGAAIDHAKLAAVSSGNVLVGNGSNQAASVAMSGDVAIAAGGATTIQANAVEIGMIGCEQTTLSDSDSHIPTSGAVVDYVAAQLAPIGGLEVIADDESFPNTIPAAGVVISITDAAGLSVNSSGVSTNGDALDNSTITINNFPSELRGGVGTNADPYVFASGAGLMVQSTGSSHTYNYHQALIREADFVRLSADIDDFNQRYRVAAGASGVRTGVCGANGTGSGNYPCDGDMCWFTGSNKMYVFDAPAASTSNSDLDAAWSEVSSVGDYKILTVQDNGEAVSGNGPTFDGPSGSTDRYDLFDGSSNASITSAQQLIVVLNGVIQKPNASYDAAGEGFALDGSNGIRFCDPPPTGSVLFVTQIGAATTLQVPATNSITNVMIQDGAIDNAAIAANAAIAPSKIDAANFAGIGSTGHIELKNETSARFFEASGNGTNKVAVKAPASLGADYTITLPPDDGDNLQFLQTNGSGVTDWATVSSTPEGTAVLSTTNSNEANTKFLRADGDGTCSWQIPSGVVRNATGTRNIAGPTTAGDALTGNAQDNTLYGYDAGTALEDGDNNVAIGAYSLIGAVDSSQNTALGSNCMTGAVTGADNVATGFFALKDTTSGANNVAVGRSALQDHTDGDANIAIGRSALENMAAGDNNVAIGKDAGLNATNISKAVLIGYEAGKELEDGTNIAIGDRALSIATGVAARSNIAIGYRAMTDIAGYSNIGIGGDCCGGGATASGAGAYYNVAIGDNALEDLTTADGCTCIGVAAGKDITTASNNTAVGYHALETVSITGTDNVAVGKEALRYCTVGYKNTAVGGNAGEDITTGERNVCVGATAGNYIQTGFDNVFIGRDTTAAAEGDDGAVVVGANIGSKGSYKAFIGGSSGIYNEQNSSAFSTTSDRRIKKNITNNTTGLDKINQITVRNFEYKTEEEIIAGASELTDSVKAAVCNKTGTQIGVIAQELESVLPGLVATDPNHGIKSVQTDNLVWYLVNAIKDLSTKNDALETRIAALEAG